MWERELRPPAGACTPESNASFCARLGKNCGAVTGTDNCGTIRTVASCGTCAAPETCGGDGAPNVCGIQQHQLRGRGLRQHLRGRGPRPRLRRGLLQVRLRLQRRRGGRRRLLGRVQGALPGQQQLEPRHRQQRQRRRGRHLHPDRLRLQRRRRAPSTSASTAARPSSSSSRARAGTRQIAVDTTVTLKAGNNSIKFYNNSAWAPDLDRIVVAKASAAGTPAPAAARPAAAPAPSASPRTATTGANWWGTITFKNTGTSSVSSYKVEFDVPSGGHCTNDAVPVGAKLSPLTGSGILGLHHLEPLRVHLDQHAAGGRAPRRPSTTRATARTSAPASNVEGRPAHLPVMTSRAQSPHAGGPRGPWACERTRLSGSTSSWRTPPDVWWAPWKLPHIIEDPREPDEERLVARIEQVMRRQLEKDYRSGRHQARRPSQTHRPARGRPSPFRTGCRPSCG